MPKTPPSEPPLSADPGASYFGWAKGDWASKELLDCGLHWNPDLHTWPPWFRQGAFHVIVETQLPTKNDRMLRRDALALSRMVGALETRGASSERVEVAQWKRSVPKVTSHKAILLCLKPHELEIYQRVCNNYSGQNKDGQILTDEELDLDSRYDISHAIGLLMYRFGRFVI